MKTYLVTGGTSGVGKAIATGIAETGAKVVIVSRNAATAVSIVKEISEKTLNKNISFLIADLSLMGSVAQLCKDFSLQHQELHGLVNAAGAWYFKKSLTTEGFDKSFTVNYLSHFALTNGLLSIMKATYDSRVVIIGGNPLFLKKPKLNLNNIQLQRSYGGLKAAGYGMVARIYFGFELADQLNGTSVSAVVIHPGFVKSNLASGAPWWLKFILSLSSSVRNAPETCESGVYAATKKDAKSINGQFLDEKGNIIQMRNNFDKSVGKQLWLLSKELLTAHHSQ
ncbi:SDR family NAD(P)-dependent oxidoreductase [Pedobacter frigidisoli]|uniref:SDR family NAD(P)-dependent oxidoreductase n=1 Tax=Pedobacter frigidisoli TaxID=2530455 RepID=A0A4V2MMR4_9SPHI|nr:SDR family NAD(P)-dependent oxidoreductase [Pedobacter frigidisoli]TCD08292.1 SDR family NAD(P)-dependent oxidoreductase [Pedobacter frigidisoli]